MADLSRCFLDFRSLATNSNLHVFLPSKHYYTSALRINGARRRQLNLTLLSKASAPTPSCADFDVISTHEHHDGSVIFRFGDPSEVAKNVKLVKSKTVKEEKERENEHGGGVVKVLDDDHQTEGLIQNVDGEVTGSGSTEVDDPTSSIVVSGKSISVDEGEIDDSCEKLLEGSNGFESPVQISSEEMEFTSIPGVEVEHYANVEDIVNEESEDSNAMDDASILDKSSEMEINVITKETADVATAVSLVSDSEPVIALPDDDVIQASEEDVVTTDVSADMEHQNMETEIQSEITEDGVESVKSDFVSPPPQSEPAISSSEEIEDQNLEAGMQNLTTEKVSESDTDDHVAVGMQNLIVDNDNGSDTKDIEAESVEAAMGVEAQASGPGTGMLREIVEYESETATVQLTTVSPQLEAEPMLGEEPVTDDLEESKEDVAADSLKELNNTPQNLILESESTEVDDDMQRGDLIQEASVHEATELKYTESVTESEETVTTDLALSSGAALLPHPSKALTGGEDAYFIAGRTWLGVADGVEQWSLEGTRPGVYAQELIKNCEKLVSDWDGNPANNPLELLNLSVAETHSPGSSTVLIAQFDGQALHVANVGDSGFMVLRNGAVYKRSSPMLHVFHFPMQIERGDDPSSLAELYRVDLEENDVIITATDGLLDNLYDQEISSIVAKLLAADKKPEEIAELLSTTAQEIGMSRSGRSPFADDAQAAGFARYCGGKLDDVAVIVSLVQKQ